MRFQSFFMSTTVHLFTAAASRATSSLPKCELAVVGIFAHRIGMVNDQAEPYPTGAERCPLQHFEIAVGVTEGGDRTAADVLVDTDRLSGFVVDEIDFGQAEKRWCAVFHFKSGLDR